MMSRDDPEKTFSVKDSEVQLQSTTGATPSVQSDETVHAPNAEEEFPEGGLEAWLTVLGAFLVQVCGFGYTMSFGVFQDYYVRVYLPNVSTSAISWIGSVASFLVMACGLPAGRIYDHGYFRYQLWGGFFLISFALFMLSLAKEGQFYQIFLAQGVAVGLGVGMLYVPSMAALSHYFRRRQSLAMSIAASGSSLGAIIHTIMLNNTLDKMGFARATRAHAGLVSILLLCAVGLMRTRLPPPKTRTNLLRAVRRFARDVPYVCAAVGCSMFIVGMYYPLFYLQLDATQHGIPKKVAFYVLVVMNVCSFIGRFSSGFLIAPLGLWNLIVASSGCCAIIMFCMTAAHNLAGVMSIGATFGLFSGIYIALVAPMMASLASDRSEIGIRMGVGFTLAGFGGLCGSPIEGALLTKEYHWWRPSVFAGLMAIFGSGFYITMLLLLRRREKKAAQSQEKSEQPLAV